MKDHTQVKVLQTAGQSIAGPSFHHTMSPGSKKCCSSTNEKCNITQEKTAYLTAIKDDKKTTNKSSIGIRCPADGMEDDTQISALQIDGQSQIGHAFGRPFYKTGISPGSKECCNFESGECNQSRQRNTPVKIDMSAAKDNGKTKGRVRSITFPSDGYIVARGTFETLYLRILHH
ncbi:hypothetical protein BDC45DRAFT_563208 [Circinella umbellata]|nr:hypothetical protein BDC45DRAFT_563208 [Circinella umbellata]